MHRFTALVLLAAVLSLMAKAQASAEPAASGAQTFVQGSSTNSDPEKKDDIKQKDKKGKDKKNQDKKKQDKKKQGDQDVLDTSIFSDRVANDVLGQIRDGLEGHSQRLMLSAFDGDKMDGYLNFEDQIQAYFNRYDAFRVEFTIVQTSVEGPKGVVIVNARLEQVPNGGGSPMRKNAQLRFELERGRKGWRVVDFRDRAFFS